MKKLSSHIVLVSIVLSFALPLRVLAQEASFSLFRARSTFSTGSVTSPDETALIAQRSLVLDFAAGDTAVISSTPDGTGHIVIDDMLMINGVNVCERELDQVNCFGQIVNPDLPVGEPIEDVLRPVPPIDVTGIIPIGTTLVRFELRDFGTIAGNTDLFLITTAPVASRFITNALPSFLESPQEGFVTPIANVLQTTSRYLTETVPYYDQTGNRCPSPVPPEQRVGLDCVGHYFCDAFDSRLNQCIGTRVLTHVTCLTCGEPPSPGPEEVQICQREAEGQRDACLHGAHSEEIICRADARETAFNFCRNERNRLRFSRFRADPLPGGDTFIVTIEQCIAERVGTRFVPTGEISIGLPPSVGVNIIRHVGPYRACANQREAEDQECLRDFRRARDNCDECAKLTCP